jgi:hypothetical protein
LAPNARLPPHPQARRGDGQSADRLVVLSTARLEPGSFRDPDSTIFYADGEVYRALTRKGHEEWLRLSRTKLFARLLEESKVVQTEEVDRAQAPPALRAAAYDVVLRHELIPFVSYPYEWTPGMLRDAALLTLDINMASLDEDLVLKDATPYNVQFKGSRPVFLDIGSWEHLEPGEPWVAYRQFCMQFLYPLMLQAYKGVPFQPWLRGAIDGITPSQMRALMSFRDRFRKGALTHVFLHARLEQRYAQSGRTGGDVKKELKSAGFGKDLLRTNMRKMRKAVEAAAPNVPASVWTAYRHENTYEDADNQAKAEFIQSVASLRDWKLAWDLGANDGRYSRIIAERARYVLALDQDPSTVELLYRDLKAEGNEQILPVVMNLTDPSPGLGWRGVERRAWTERGTPELILALALLHHVSITGNVPVRQFVDWLASFDSHVVIEFMTREDAMVRKLLSAKRISHDDYNRGFFEQCIRSAFAVERIQELPSGTRILYALRPRR